MQPDISNEVFIMSDERFKHESMQDTESILKYLDALRSGFETGQIVFSSKNQ